MSMNLEEYSSYLTELTEIRSKHVEVVKKKKRLTSKKKLVKKIFSKTEKT